MLGGCSVSGLCTHVHTEVVLLGHFLSYSFDTGSHIEPGARLATQQAPGILWGGCFPIALGL